MEIKNIPDVLADCVKISLYIVFLGAVANQLKSGNFLRQKKIFIKEAITV